MAFKFGVTVPLPFGAVESACLGVDGTAGSRFAQNDLNKLVKLGSANNYVPVAAGDAVEAVVTAVDAGGTENGGYSFGSVQRRFYELEVQVVGATLAVGDQVVAAAQNALGTAQNYPLVQKIAAETPTFRWRVKSLLSGNGAAGTVVLIEPLTR